jgi:hypothetical protein
MWATPHAWPFLALEYDYVTPHGPACMQKWHSKVRRFSVHVPPLPTSRKCCLRIKRRGINRKGYRNSIGEEKEEIV